MQSPQLLETQSLDMVAIVSFQRVPSVLGEEMRMVLTHKTALEVLAQMEFPTRPAVSVVALVVMG